jgi:HD-GYP domain-containing protein (c-di-GMP phosphodiesterase class II)
MQLNLPTSLFVANRFTQSGEDEFRLTARYRDALQAECERKPVLPALEEMAASPLQDIPLLIRHFDPILRNALNINGLEDKIVLLARTLIARVRRNRDGYLATILLQVDRDGSTTRHALYSAIIAIRICDALQASEQDTVSLVCAALTTNVGAVRLHDEMSRQQAAPTTLQRQLIGIHPLTSAAILTEAGVTDERWRQGILLHHEKRDGMGYPFGLSDKDIPVHAHLMHILDIVTAKLMPRSYRERLPIPQALGALYTSRHEPIDVHIAAHLVRILGLYPPGSFVELKNGEIALVVQVGANAAAPLVASLSSASPQLIDTAQPSHRIAHDITVPITQEVVSGFAKYWKLARESAVG